MEQLTSQRPFASIRRKKIAQIGSVMTGG